MLRKVTNTQNGMVWCQRSFADRRDGLGLAGCVVLYMGPKKHLPQPRLGDTWLKLQHRKILCFHQQEAKYDSEMGQGH